MENYNLNSEKGYDMTSKVKQHQSKIKIQIKWLQITLF